MGHVIERHNRSNILLLFWGGVGGGCHFLKADVDLDRKRLSPEMCQQQPA